jgi:phage internal scaffolding protein
MKYDITDIAQVGKKGPGMYRLKQGKRIRCITYNGTDSKVEQSQEHLTNVSELLEPAIKRGLLRHSVKFEGEYDDIPVKDYQQALIIQAQAKSMFEQLPAKIRDKFENDPAQFLAFTQNPNNAEEMRKMGMIKGNDGKIRGGDPSGAPTVHDHNADGIADKNPDGTTALGQPKTNAEPPPA